MLRVFCSRYMTDWDKYLLQAVGAYNSKQHSTTGISPFMMLTGRERAIPLKFSYPENEGQKTSPQAYVKEAIKRQQELSVLCRRITAQARKRQRRKYDEKTLQSKRNHMQWENMSGFSRMSYLKRIKEVIEEMERTVHGNRGAPAG